MEIRIHEDEAYPDYHLNAETARVVLDVPDEVAERWLAARAAWDQACDEIYEAYRAVVYPESGREQPYPGRQI